MLIRSAIALSAAIAWCACAEAAPSVRGEPVASDLPDSEKQRISDESLRRMWAALNEVLPLIQEARNTGDAVRLNCVQEKWTQLKSLVRIAEQAGMQLEEAIARREAPTAEHEFEKVRVIRSYVERLRTQAEQCVRGGFGNEAEDYEPSSVPETPPGDPTQIPPPPDTRPLPTRR